MKEKPYTKTELDYRRFDRFSKVFICIILLLTVLLIGLFLFAREDGRKLLYGILLAADTVFIIFTSAKIGNKRTEFEEQLREERRTVPRTGLFREIYEDWRHDGLEFNLSFDRLLFEQYRNNTIDMGFLRNGHEILVTVDPEVLSVIIDEEEDRPVEIELPLAELSSLEEFYQKISQILEAHAK